MDIVIIPQLRDNYSFLLTSANGETAVVDPTDAEPVREALDARGLTLHYILNTHHHWDHTDGNLPLKDRYECQVIGPEAERDKIPGIDAGLKHGDFFKCCGTEFETISTPGHTAGHICFYSAAENIVFTGDTLFSLGCGRLFEGTPLQMWDSLTRLMKLPGGTMIYCGHEYTLPNGRFCQSLEPDNEALAQRMEEARWQRKVGNPTIPVSLDTEKATNIFLRAGSAARFAELRALRDQG